MTENAVRWLIAAAILLLGVVVCTLWARGREKYAWLVIGGIFVAYGAVFLAKAWSAHASGGVIEPFPGDIFDDVRQSWMTPGEGGVISGLLFLLGIGLAMNGFRGKKRRS